MNFYELLQEIKRRPALYLSRKSIFDFHSFLQGYEIARINLGFTKTEEEIEFDNFLEWLRKICPVKTHHTWANLILFYSADERDALDKLFALFDDYQAQKHNEIENDDVSK
ncbi:hypothetical protein VF14_13275 [Nostoc linckia z18]|uniref:Uncharacterized protein n=2 Tax=Nostoc linckia TaxID=92942 RepID=A0A9Q5ZCJ9_NOSLI|nr:hypothetical protein [Nostoc linckia]PHK40963.1 hypothetical protein VF12_08415 [Nostoc linckia z15]PHK46187.1 hypothetical protein VF13_12075 [Nostoc linckia z16]PHJ62929.1 hypothetical protein VF02_16135 [Nostoc linckia z1]PHJ66808.1 hypothetical protein VF05_18225 [Nostoc linckia z3]PHJ70222.1 hypothetical protein VF03_22375 [Nostoc linckia z2]